MSVIDDLPATEREDLLAEVEASLRDAAEEGGAIAPRLGSPVRVAHPDAGPPVRPPNVLPLP